MHARILALTLLCVPALSAQAPLITKGGDPSIGSDSIYALAGKLGGKTAHGTVILFDDAVLRLDARGRGTRTYRTVTWVNDVQGVLQTRLSGAACDPTYCHLHLNWARVLRPDGTVISKEPFRFKDDFRPPDDDRGYDHERSMRWLLSGVEPGTIVDESYTEEIDSMPLGMELPPAWHFASTTAEVRRSRFLLDVSDSLSVFIEERNLGFQRSESHGGGRRVYAWITKDLARVETEPFVPDSDVRAPFISFHTMASWQAVGEWYQRRSLTHLDLEKAGLKRYGEVTMYQPYLADTIDAIYRFAVQGVRSTWTEPGRSGFIPWRPDHTIEKYTGDSQDKSALLVAMLRKAGVNATYVLAVKQGWRDAEQPSPARLAGALVRIVQGTDTLFADPDSRFLPPGVLPRRLAGAIGIVVPQTGPVTVIRLPRPASDATGARHVMAGAMDTAGRITWRHTVELTGTAQEEARRAFWARRDSASRRYEATRDARIDLPGATGDSLTTFDPRDNRAAPSYAFTVHGPPQRSNGRQTLLPLEFADLTPYVAAAEYLEHHQPRRSPVSIEQVVGDSSVSYDVRLTLPEGWTAMRPPDLDARSEFGTVVRTYAQEGRELHLTQLVVGATGSIPPERVGALIAWLRRVTKYRAPYLIIAHRAN